jgi:D-glycero-D-manno-heptose 1,7-bisphosphate phosphatase
MRAGVFLDRDGVINENRADYVKAWGEVQFLPGVFEALARLSDTAFCILLVTNQSAVGRGIVSEEEVASIHRHLVAEITAHGGRVDGIYTCPHHPTDSCACRKPQPGLLLQAAQERGLDLERSYLVGDAVSDVEAAQAAGCFPILVLTGRGRHQQRLLAERKYLEVPVVRNLAAAVQLILDKESARSPATWQAAGLQQAN